MRGLKPNIGKTFTARYVASFTDAWIETLKQENGKLTLASHLLQMRGLKREMTRLEYKTCCVASFTDAWIETQYLSLGTGFVVVASFTDAWIETGLKESRRSR